MRRIGAEYEWNRNRSEIGGKFEKNPGKEDKNQVALESIVKSLVSRSVK